MDKNHKKTEEFVEKCYRKGNVIFVLRGILFLLGLILMLAFLLITNSSEGKSSVLEFFLLVETIIIIGALESYMNTLTIGKSGVVLESGIILKHKTEIPYKKINSINVHSIFGLGTLEILTGNDVITRYKYLAKYDEVENLIKECMDNKE